MISTGVRVDLHTHSTASDGRDTPSELIQAAADSGVDVVALTDHDTVAGWAEAARQAEASQVTLVPGAEVSCQASGVSLHLLGYLFDADDPDLQAELARTRDDRIPRAQAMVRLLAEAGHPITWDDVLAQVSTGATVGRPHIADALVAAGVAPTRSVAFDRLLHSGSPYYLEHYATDPIDAIRLVHAAGGVTVFAHPGAHRRGRIVDDEVIHAMADAGLDGLEVDHRDHDRTTRDRLRALAREQDLLVTGASDYHGSGRANRLGENLTDPEVYAEIVRRAGHRRCGAGLRVG
jgi:predicted metal-dependent phosphoesterase TrpH